MGLLDPSPRVGSAAGFEPYGTCRFATASAIHILMAAAGTLTFPRHWRELAAAYASYQVVDFYINNDTLLLNLGEYLVGLALSLYWRGGPWRLSTDSTTT